MRSLNHSVNDRPVWPVYMRGYMYGISVDKCHYISVYLCYGVGCVKCYGWFVGTVRCFEIGIPKKIG
jgi:hypothetical protein